jgi:SAM-dependent methyltransferase
MPIDADSSLSNRLLALWEHFGLRAAFVATQMPTDLAAFAARHPERIAGAVFCTPNRLDAEPFRAIADRLLLIAGERGVTAGTTSRAQARLPAALRSVLADYDALGWSDVVADRTVEVAERMRQFLQGRDAATPRPVGAHGTHAGISYRVEGSGPALFLLPFFLAPSQWLPAVPALGRHFTVITLGGAHLGGVAALEDRARAPTYRAMFNALIDLIAPRPGEPILEVGCGAGSLVRLLARRVGAANPITAVDVNPFLLREAAALAAADGLASAIAFAKGNAEALPFADGAFGCAFSVTVLEECDADRAIAEMMRIVRPGGRVGIIVRAIDIPQWWNLAIPEAMRRKVEAPPPSVSANGVADASLYRRMRRAGFGDLVCYPALVTLDRPEGPIWRYREDHVLSLLTAEETEHWQGARAAAAAQELLIAAHAMHCAIGTKP